MDKPPERIWLQWNGDAGLVAGYTSVSPGDVEYVRRDVADAEAAKERKMIAQDMELCAKSCKDTPAWQQDWRSAFELAAERIRARNQENNND